MKDINFPLFKTKIEGAPERFNLNDPAGRRDYFALKCGTEIEKVRAYLKGKTFIAFLLGPKNSGKGTYSKLFMEAIGGENIGHLSIGDLVRDVHEVVENRGEAYGNLKKFLEESFRGFHSLEEVDDIILGRSTATLISSELILALVKWEIARRPRQALFIDGFPRALDQVGYTLFLKEIIGYQAHPDFFVFIDVPLSVIDERIKYRVICPVCKTPRSLKLLATKEVGWDEAMREFYLKCDNPSCAVARMVPKEGDELGIAPIRERLETDEKIFRQLLELSGVPKVKLRNSIPVSAAKEFVDDYELTPEYYYERDSATGVIRTLEKPWIIQDDNGIPSYSLLPPAIVVSLIKQVTEVLGL